jgi:hypothetical protein
MVDKGQLQAQSVSRGLKNKEGKEMFVRLLTLSAKALSTTQEKERESSSMGNEVEEDIAHAVISTPIERQILDLLIVAGKEGMLNIVSIF